MLAYRVFPYLPSAADGEPGHPLFASPRQGKGRWDNPDRYSLAYVAHTPEAAIGEAFGNLASWTPEMLIFPVLPGSTRVLGIYSIDEERHPVLDLDDAVELSARAIRPTHVVITNRPRTQAMAARIYDEDRWAGIQWWSHRRPQWTLSAIWHGEALSFDHAEELAGHPAMAEAARALGKVRSGI